MDGKISKAELASVFEGGGAKMTEEFWKESDPDGSSALRVKYQRVKTSCNNVIIV
jgi:hypothetical protein